MKAGDYGESNVYSTRFNLSGLNRDGSTPSITYSDNGSVITYPNGSTGGSNDGFGIPLYVIMPIVENTQLEPFQ